jgi:hypothetical protein
MTKSGIWSSVGRLRSCLPFFKHQNPGCSASLLNPPILNALAGIGRLQDSPEINSPYPTIVAVMGSGFMKLNPCLITVEIAPYSDSKSKAVIRGAAKEGLIKQGTAEKAVIRVIDAIKGERV